MGFKSHVIEIGLGNCIVYQHFISVYNHSYQFLIYIIVCTIIIILYELILFIPSCLSDKSEFLFCNVDARPVYIIH